MSELETLSAVANGLLIIAGIACPEAAAVIGIVRAAIPAAVAAEPYIAKAVQDGRSAFQAAIAASPELEEHIKALAARMPATAAAPEIHLENVTRAVFGFHHMTSDEERVWMDRATEAASYGQA